MAAGWLRLDKSALTALVNGPAGETIMRGAAEIVRDRARVNAGSISPRLAASIAVETGRDTDGAYADVGYDKGKPGWVLWFAEVGTLRQPAQPHLRPALDG